MIEAANISCTALSKDISDKANSRQGFGKNCIWSSMGNEFCGYSVVNNTDPLAILLQHETKMHNKSIDGLYFSFYPIYVEPYSCDIIVASVPMNHSYMIAPDYTGYCNLYNLLRSGNANHTDYNVTIEMLDDSACQYHPFINNTNGPKQTNFDQSNKICNIQ